MEKIVFLMPHDGIVSSGGYKVVYEYANRLAKEDFSVTIVYPNTKKDHSTSLENKLRDFARYIIRAVNKGYRSKWFDLDKRIELKWVWSLDDYRPQGSCCVVATAVETAFSLKRYPACIRKFYFIQDFENWYYSDQQVFESYHFPMKKIVIAKWLQQIVISCGETATVIPNGFDFTSFSCQSPIERRDKYTIICMYHIDKRKGMDVAFKAFARVYSRIPQIKVILFSVYDRPNDLPGYCDFIKQPTVSLLNQLYNKASIYVGPSHVEGWGLTVGEAMQCGCAVACTDNKGYLEMARDEETALTSPIGDAESLAENIIRFIEDDALRVRIASNGESFIHNCDIDSSYVRFRNLLMTVNQND